MTLPSDPIEPAEAIKLRAAEAVRYLHQVFGRTVRRLRNLHMILLPDLAASLGISEAQMEAIEAGETFVTPQIRAKLELIFEETL